MNSKLFPFERNRYYLGKPLTSADFVSEQTYFNDKRRLLNRLIFDHGIVTGLSVFRIDELTISVDSGLAIDRSGREIVVPSLIAKKLSSIANFEKIKSEEMYLCLQYSERESQTGVNNSDNISGTANEHNRFEEGYELILRAPGELISEPEPISAFVFRKVLFDDGSLRVIQKYPKIGRVQDNILFKTVIENIGNEPLDIQLSYKMSAPGILGEDGGSQVTVDFGKIKLLPKK
ncbi:MAG: hypothetical protein IJC39_02945, partial [Firmicutes bacterium]|nr:hypothetical protein [Bacillota bacterium]